MTIKHTYVRGQIVYYQRSIPLALRDRYPAKTLKIKLGLPSKDLARKVTELDRLYDAEFAYLLSSPEASPDSIKAHAEVLLRGYGLTPSLGNHEELVDSFLDEVVEPKRRAYAGQDMELYLDAPFEAYLTPVEASAAIQITRGIPQTLRHVLKVYLSVHPKADRPKFVTFQTAVFEGLIKSVGDIPITSLKRAEARKHLDLMKARGSKTGTIKRHLGALHSIFKSYYLEAGISEVNPFSSLLIKGAGEDAKKANPYTPEELSLLVTECRAKADPLRLALLILMDTGARLAEVIGIHRSDLVLDHETPHLVIQPHPWRSLKNLGSARKVPLVGQALWAAETLLDRHPGDEAYPFSKYTSEARCKADNASAALLGWVKDRTPGHTNHELRHTLTDRLREVECPPDIRKSITGHSSGDVGDDYGDGYSLKTKVKWMNKVAPIA